MKKTFLTSIFILIVGCAAPVLAVNNLLDNLTKEIIVGNTALYRVIEKTQPMIVFIGHATNKDLKCKSLTQQIIQKVKEKIEENLRYELGRDANQLYKVAIRDKKMWGALEEENYRSGLIASSEESMKLMGYSDIIFAVDWLLTDTGKINIKISVVLTPNPKNKLNTQKLNNEIASKSIDLPQTLFNQLQCLNNQKTPIPEMSKHTYTLLEKKFNFGKYEVTHKQFKAFIDKTNYETDAEKLDNCYAFYLGATDAIINTGATWKKPIKQKPLENAPVTCVSQNDAQKYVQWLRVQTGEHYRLPTAKEWFYAASNKNQITRKYYWGDEEVLGCRYDNLSDITFNLAMERQEFNCSDNQIYPSVVNQYYPYPGSGLYNLSGNVAEWTCSDYRKGDASTQLFCGNDIAGVSRDKIIVGASWFSEKEDAEIGFIDDHIQNSSANWVGFRVLLEL
jgi:formylglycine-generating enzyme